MMFAYGTSAMNSPTLYGTTTQLKDKRDTLLQGSDRIPHIIATKRKAMTEACAKKL